MLNPLVYITIDGIPLSLDTIQSFEITASIRGLPEGKISIMDIGGFKSSRFDFTIGSQVVFEFIEQGDTQEKDPKKLDIKLYPLIVTSVMNNVTRTELPTLGGVVTLVLKHPLLYYRDFTDHAYSAMPISELIKKIVENNSRGWQIDVDQNDFELSADNGKQNRYKCGISDYDFIVQQLLPFAYAKTGSLYFFIDEFGKPFLKSYPKLINEPETAIMTTINDLKKQIEVVKPQKVVPVSDVKFCIGMGPNGELLFKHLKVKTYMEELKSRRFQTGSVVPKTKISGESGKISGNKLPFVLVNFETSTPTDAKILTNRTANDQAGLSNTNKKALDSMFMMNLGSGWCGDVLSVGKTINFVTGKNQFMGETDEKAKAKMSWTNGKWLVSSIKHSGSTVGADGSRMKMTPSTMVEVIRPTYIINEKDTSVFAPELLWSVDA